MIVPSNPDIWRYAWLDTHTKVAQKLTIAFHVTVHAIVSVVFPVRVSQEIYEFYSKTTYERPAGNMLKEPGAPALTSKEWFIVASLRGLSIRRPRGFFAGSALPKSISKFPATSAHRAARAVRNVVNAASSSRMLVTLAQISTYSGEDNHTIPTCTVASGRTGCSLRDWLLARTSPPRRH